MKKSVLSIIVVVAVLAALFAPVPGSKYDDGGSREYNALTYKLVKWNRLLTAEEKDALKTDDDVYKKTSVYWGKEGKKDIDELWTGIVGEKLSGGTVQNAEKENHEPTTGPDAEKLDARAREIFEKATNKLTGQSFEMLSYVMKSEWEYYYLCEGTATVPGAEAEYVLVKVGIDGDSATVVDIIESGVKAITASDEKLDGGWIKSEKTKVSATAKLALEKASETLTGATYNPIALLGEQDVQGKNYLLFCEISPSIPSQASKFGLVYLYRDLDGNASITDVKEFEKADGKRSGNEEQTAVTHPEASVVYGSYADASKEAGFDLDTPDLASASFVVVEIAGNDGKVFQINFDGGYIRKAKEGDSLGDGIDGNIFDTAKNETIAGKDILLLGDKSKMKLMLWEGDGFRFAVRFNDGLEWDSKGYEPYAMMVR